MSSRNLKKKAAGTKSPEGIKRSSINALAHGLTAKTLVLPNESQAEFNQLRLDYFNRFRPSDTVEMDLVDDLVAARWRLRRLIATETASLAMRIKENKH